MSNLIHTPLGPFNRHTIFRLTLLIPIYLDDENITIKNLVNPSTSKIQSHWPQYNGKFKVNLFLDMLSLFLEPLSAREPPNLHLTLYVHDYFLRMLLILC
jgi:hypothetical protein